LEILEILAKNSVIPGNSRREFLTWRIPGNSRTGIPGGFGLGSDILWISFCGFGSRLAGH